MNFDGGTFQFFTMARIDKKDDSAFQFYIMEVPTKPKVISIVHEVCKGREWYAICRGGILQLNENEIGYFTVSHLRVQANSYLNIIENWKKLSLFVEIPTSRLQRDKHLMCDSTRSELPHIFFTNKESLRTSFQLEEVPICKKAGEKVVFALLCACAHWIYR